VDRLLTSMDDTHAWAGGQTGDRFARMPGRMLGVEATFVQARRDGVTPLEAGEDVWGITLHDGSAQAVWAMLQGAHARRAPEIEWIPQPGLSGVSTSAGGCGTPGAPPPPPRNHPHRPGTTPTVQEPPPPPRIMIMKG
jgi:hypothetical protein